MPDRISDFLTIIRNASMARKETCRGIYSKQLWSISQVLKEVGYIRDVREEMGENGHRTIEVTLKYVDEVPAITSLKRWSKPGRRLYYKCDDIPRILGGLGVGILTTSQGVMDDRQARERKIGGELICAVW
jgi:small subunit ribosomal protein S8